MKYGRVLLKMSGEALQGLESGLAIDPGRLALMTRRVAAARAMGAEVGIVIGGGNIFRGLGGQAGGIERATGDFMGMMATVINALALRDSLEKDGIAAHVLSAFEVGTVVERFERRRALALLTAGVTVVFAAGTGNPYFTTDTAAALRASEIGADALLKATRVDGVFSADPEKDKGAERFERISYDEVLQRRLGVMDATAISLCRENRIPVVVFDVFLEGNLERVLRGEGAGTLVCE